MGFWIIDAPNLDEGPGLGQEGAAPGSLDRSPSPGRGGG
jgi:hypothetical protein